MCDQTALHTITSAVVQTAKNSLGDKLDKVILYGSYARGDYDDESDIDILILADVSAEEADRLDMALTRFTSRLGLEHDVVISLFVKDCETFYGFLPVVPLYQNVMNEGVLLRA